jgi:hypothetical protein
MSIGKATIFLIVSFELFFKYIPFFTLKIMLISRLNIFSDCLLLFDLDSATTAISSVFFGLLMPIGFHYITLHVSLSRNNLDSVISQFFTKLVQ